MKLKILGLAILGSVSLSLSLSGCLMTREEIAGEEQKKAVQQQVSNLQKSHADAQSHYTELNEELRDLHGKIESLENRQTTVARDREKTQNLNDQQLAETNKKVLLLHEEIQKLENQVSFLSQELIKVSQVQATAASAPVSTGDKPKAGEKKADTFKLGEDAFNKKDWRNAILQYENYRKFYPKGRHVAVATYRIGLCFKELGMKDEAKTFFEEVISNYRDTALAKQAKDQLKKKRE